MIALCLCFPVFGLIALAGNSGAKIENGAIFEGDELSISEWSFPRNSGIALEEYNGKNAVAIKTQNVGKILTSYTAVKTSKDVDDTLSIFFALSVKKLLSGNPFGFVFGSPKLRDNINAAGTTFFYINKEGTGYKYGLKNYAASGEKKLAEGSLTSSQADDLSVKMAVTGSGKIDLTVNGNVVYSSAAENEVKAEGFLGFVHDGEQSLTSTEKTEVYITDMKIVNNYYDRPETPLITRADFSNNEFNTEEWHLRNSAAAPNGGLFVEDNTLSYNGSGQNALFGTTHKYSNFDLQYDLFDAKNYGTIEKNGWVNTASYWQGVVFGIAGDDISATFARNDNRDYLIYFQSGFNTETGERTSDITSMGFLAKGKYVKIQALPDKFSVFKKGYTDKVRVRITVIDGKLTVRMKLVGEYEWTDIYSYEFDDGYTPTGYISLHGEGNQFVLGRTYYGASYFKLDNIQLANYDMDPKTVKVGFTSNVLKPFADYAYVDNWSDDYLVVYTRGKGSK